MIENSRKDFEQEIVEKNNQLSECVLQLRESTELIEQQQSNIDQLHGQIEMLRGELGNIAHAKRFDKERFHDDSGFADWAQNRATHTLLAATESNWAEEFAAKVLEEAAKWFEEDGCTLLPSSVECAVELRRMGADLKA